MDDNVYQCVRNQVTVKSYIQDLTDEVQRAAVDSRIFIVYPSEINNDNPTTRAFFRSISNITNRLIAIEANINVGHFSRKYNIAGPLRSRRAFTDYALSNSARFREIYNAFPTDEQKEVIY